MDVLATSKQVLSWLSLYVADGDIDKRKAISYICVSFMTLISNASLVLCSALYISKYISNDLEEALYACGQLIAFLSSTYMLLIAFILRKKITAIINELAAIYETCKLLLFFIKY